MTEELKHGSACPVDGEPLVLCSSEHTGEWQGSVLHCGQDTTHNFKPNGEPYR